MSVLSGWGVGGGGGGGCLFTKQNLLAKNVPGVLKRKQNVNKIQQGNSVARDLPRTGSETNTTIFVIYIYWI